MRRHHADPEKAARHRDRARAGQTVIYKVIGGVGILVNSV